MGLVVPQIVRVKTSKKTCKYYREKGYEFEKWGDFIEVNVLDLPKRSGTKVKIICDVCGKEAEICYGDFVGYNEENKLITCASNSCKHKKYEDTCTKKYGVNNPFQSHEIKEKIKATWKNNYGEDITSPFQLESVKEKSKQTMLNNYGVEHTSQNRELLNKMLDSFQFNGTGPCSRAQKYIHFLIGGVLNKRVCNSLVDICFEEEKIAIEYDGGGHFLGDIMNGNAFPTKEALLKEKNREDSIVNKGYKVIRFIATKDRIPSDEVILNLIEEFKNSDFKVVRIDFEKGTIEKDYNEKWHCNFGELRKITKEDLERFENKKAINLK